MNKTFFKIIRKNDGAFSKDSPPDKVCIVCGIYYPGKIERHHGKTKGAGGSHIMENRFDLCTGPPNDCHGRAQRREIGYGITELLEAKEKHKKRAHLYEQIMRPKK